MAIAPGTRLGRYDIRSALGSGGMGEVYLAEDIRLHRKVAIKFLPSDTTNDEHARKRLLREAQSAAALDHPNICAIHEVGEADGCHFIVMQSLRACEPAFRDRRQHPQDAALALGKSRRRSAAMVSTRSAHRVLEPARHLDSVGWSRSNGRAGPGHE